MKILYFIVITTVLLPAAVRAAKFEDGVSQYRSYDPNNDDFERIAVKEQKQVIVEEMNKSKENGDNFSFVLEELMANFAKDVRKSQLDGLQNISIRKVSVNRAIPKSYESYIDYIISEQIRENSKVRIINCISCRSKSTKIINRQLYVSTPSSDVELIRQTAERLGIENFMDIILLYQKSHMILGIQIFNASSQELVWSRTYNSETLNSRFQAMAVDYKQIVNKEQAESDEYVPTFRMALGVGAGSYRDPSTNSSNSSMMSFQLRGTEKFNNRLNEFGLLVAANMSITSIMASNSTEETDTGVDPLQYSLGLIAVYAHNFLKPLEFYDRIRWGINFGVGGQFSNAYVAPVVRAGVDMFLENLFCNTSCKLYR